MTYREDEKGHDTKIGGGKKSKRNGRDKVARKVRQVERKGMRWEKWRQNRACIYRIVTYYLATSTFARHEKCDNSADKHRFVICRTDHAST